MNKAKSNIKKGTTDKVNVAAVLVQYFMGGMVRALQRRRIRSAVVPLSSASASKYEPHQGKKEVERRLKQAARARGSRQL